MNETISKADLISLFDVVEAATGVYNVLEKHPSLVHFMPEIELELKNLGHEAARAPRAGAR